MKRYPATFFILLTSLFLQVMFTAHPSLVYYFVFNPSTWMGRTFGLITHMVSHGNWAHLIGNFTFGLAPMIYLEHKLGRKRFLEFYLICGFASCGLQYILGGPGALIGSSGAIFGVMAGACMFFGETMEESILALAFFLVLFIKQLALAPMGFLFGIAFYGHIGGGLAGLLLSTRFYQPEPIGKVQ